jgi:hypothetical protein
MAVTAAVAGCGGSDDPSGSAAATVHLHARRATFQPIDRTKQRSRPGDQFIASSALKGGGHKEAYCVFTPRRRTAWCAITIVLRRGQITAEGVFTDAPQSSGTIAVLSGGGAFAGARGSLTTSGVAARDESITVRLL